MPQEIAEIPKKPYKPGVRFTGEILLRTRPKTFRKVVDMLALPTATIDGIANECRVSQHTVMAIRTRQATEIATKKNEIVHMLADVSHVGAARMHDRIGKAQLRDASIATGIAIQRMLELQGQGPSIQIANVVLPSDEERAERRALHDKLDEIAQRLRDTAP